MSNILPYHNPKNVLEKYINAVSEAGYPWENDFTTAFVKNDGDKFIAVELDTVAGDYCVGEFFKRKEGKHGEFGCAPLYEGTLEGCLNYIHNTIKQVSNSELAWARQNARVINRQFGIGR